jgi:hypothetical protein
MKSYEQEGVPLSFVCQHTLKRTSMKLDNRRNNLKYLATTHLVGSYNAKCCSIVR